jgi:exosortase
MRKIPPIVLFLGLCALSLILCWRPIAATLSLAIHNDEYTHILIIVPISFGLIFLRRHILKASIDNSAKWLSSGILFILAAGLFITVNETGIFPFDDHLTLLMAAVVLWWLASFIVSYGVSAFLSFLFPLCFLFWIVPWPGGFLDWVVSLLQHGSASLTRIFFEIFAVPVLQQGVHLSIPGLNIEVATECSSIRSSLILLVTAMLLAYMSLRSNWKRLLVVLLAIPLSIFKNGVRIFTLAMLGVHVDRGFLRGHLHYQGGIVFFALALLILWLFARLLERMENRGESKLVALAAARSPQ